MAGASIDICSRISESNGGKQPTGSRTTTMSIAKSTTAKYETTLNQLIIVQKATVWECMARKKVIMKYGL